MAIDPDSLLIFRARKKEESKEAEKEPELPKEEKRLFLPRQPVKEQTADAQTAKARNFWEMSSQTKMGKSKPQQEVSNAAAEENIKHTLGMSDNADTYAEADTSKQAGQQSKTDAKGNYCVWHPWRAAYAICAYCHRPFCFQDTVELNNQYYCLEDIDIVSHTYRERVTMTTNTVTIAAGVLLMFAFLTFFYYSNVQVLFVIGYINRVGISYFIANAAQNYLYVLAEIIAIGFAFIAALFLFAQSRKAFYIGMIVTLAAIVLFSNQYASTGTLSTLAITVMIFASFLLLLYSRATRATSEVENQLVNPSYYQTERNTNARFPNTGKF